MTQIKGTPIIAVIAIIIGIILLIYPETTLSLILYTIGALLIISGIASIMDFYRLKKNSLHPSNTMILNGVISCLVGIVLVSSPLFLVGFMLTILSIILILMSLGQIINLFSAKRAGAPITKIMFTMPLILFGLGLVMLSAPIHSSITITSMFGAGVIIFSSMELVSYYIRKRYIESRQEEN